MGLCQACVNEHGSVQALLRTHGLLNNKHVPVGYLRASEAQRRDLLAGLLDTDGTVTSNGNVQFTTTSKALADGVYELIVSLGYRCSVATKPVRGRSAASSTVYDLNFSTHDTVFRLLGSQLEALTAETEFILDAGTYQSRQLASVRLPGALVSEMTFTL
jgi:replicative DNA helicase